MATKATQKRIDAMVTVCEEVVTYDREIGANVWHYGPADCDVVTEKIRNLKSLGRTARWTDAVEAWALLMEENADSESAFQWAFFQGNVYTAHNAE